MKYVVIIADGAADLPIVELGGRTALEAAHTPNLDRLASLGELMTACTTPPGWLAGSDVCTMDLLGYDPRVYHTGRAPLEAASMGVAARATDWIYRLNLVTVGEPGTSDEGLMLDHSGGAISDEEAWQLTRDLLAHWRAADPSLVEPRLLLQHGVSYRSILVDGTGRNGADLVTTPPHEIPRQAWAEHLPRGSKAPSSAASVFVNVLMEQSRGLLGSHPINLARLAAGKRPANMAWLWGQGTKPQMPSFEGRFGLRGAMITAVDLLAGIARLIGWERLNVRGVTSYHDTDYAAQGRATWQALETYDIVCCHVESPDEASHQGDWQTKVAGIEHIDRFVVGPVLEHLLGMDATGTGWRMMVLPDHYTLVSTRKHDATPVPVLMVGGQSGLASRPAGMRFTEANANRAGRVVAEGHTLMDAFLAGR
ncbi:MAG: 2,3-bisphosphoglycerate-independent phosphoglycerate mutase [Phycisphaerales bacterium]